MSHLGDQVVAVLLAIIGVAIVATIVSNHANTVGVLNAASGSFNNAIKTAVSPITGSGSGISLNDVPSPSTGLTAGGF
jgi:hypothetical protein